MKDMKTVTDYQFFIIMYKFQKKEGWLIKKAITAVTSATKSEYFSNINIILTRRINLLK